MSESGDRIRDAKRALEPGEKISSGAGPELSPEGEDRETVQEARGRGDRSESRREDRHKESMASAVQARRFRRVVFGVAVLFSFIPACMLGWLGWSVFSGGFGVFVEYANGVMGPFPATVFIFGVFSAFIAAFGFLIRGAFLPPPQKDVAPAAPGNNDRKSAGPGKSGDD